MKPISCTIILFLIFIQGLFAQQTEPYSRSLEIHVMPVAMADYTPRLRLGMEYNPDRKWGYVLDVGLGTNALNKGRLDGLRWGADYFLYEFRPELKYYFKRFNNVAFYCATELFYINMKDDLENGYFHHEESDLLTYYDQATFKKNKTGLHFKGGIKLVAFKRIDLDYYAGIGIAYRKIKYSDVLVSDTGNYLPTEEWWGHDYKYQGGSTLFHLALGMRIGVILWK